MPTCPECHNFLLTGPKCPRDKKALLDDAEAKKRGITPRIAERYLVEKLLGEGGMGSVFLAQHETLQRKVAIKILRREGAIDDPQASARFKREAKAASVINHRHVVSILDFGELPDGSAYYVMENLEGKSLADAIDQEAPFPVPRSLSIAIQVAKGLKAAHEKGVTHRDLKPDNIFLVAGQEMPDFVKILDFGVAKVATDNQKITKTGMVLGTPDYMAPEQAIGKPADHRVDVYALGILIYEMLAGELPFRGASFMEVLSQHIYHPPPLLAEVHPELGVPGELEEVIQKALKKRPENRYQSMDELLEALMAVPGYDGLQAAQLSRAMPALQMPKRMPSVVEAPPSRRVAPLQDPGDPVPSRRVASIPDPERQDPVPSRRMAALPAPERFDGRRTNGVEPGPVSRRVASIPDPERQDPVPSRRMAALATSAVPSRRVASLQDPERQDPVPSRRMAAISAEPGASARRATPETRRPTAWGGRPVEGGPSRRMAALAPPPQEDQATAYESEQTLLPQEDQATRAFIEPPPPEIQATRVFIEADRAPSDIQSTRAYIPSAPLPDDPALFDSIEDTDIRRSRGKKPRGERWEEEGFSAPAPMLPDEDEATRTSIPLSSPKPARRLPETATDELTRQGVEAAQAVLAKEKASPAAGESPAPFSGSAPTGPAPTDSPPRTATPPVQAPRLELSQIEQAPAPPEPSGSGPSRLMIVGAALASFLLVALILFFVLVDS